MQVIHRVGLQFREKLELVPVMWEREPLLASGHFQEALDPRDSDVMICILWSRMGSPLPKEFLDEDDELGITGTGWEFKVAVEAHEKEGTPEILVYRKTAPLTAQISGASDNHVKTISDQRAVNSFFDTHFHNDDENRTFKRAYFQFNDVEEFEQKLEEHLFSLVKTKLTAELLDTGQSESVTWFQGSPYRGLCAFELEHKDVFFGRTKATGEIIQQFKNNNARGCPFVMVLGMSGSGKSSLVNAGLLPLFLSPRVVEHEVGHIEMIRFQPGKIDRSNGFLLGFCQYIVDCIEAFSEAGLTGEVLLEQLERSPKSFALSVKQALKVIKERKTLHTNVNARMLLVIDQTEELFTTDGIGQHEQLAFWELVQALIKSGGFWCIGTMRTDFVGMASGSELIELMRNEGQYTLQPFRESELEPIMVSPAKAAGLHFEQNEQGVSLASVIRDDCRGQPGVLPLLEFCLDELYKLRDKNKNMLTFAAYHEQLGGLVGAIATKADAVVESFDQDFDVDNVLPNVLNNLIAFNPDNAEAQASAKYAPMEVFVAGSKERRLVEALINERLLIQSEGKVRVAHEAIIANWRRVQQWLAIDIEFQLWKARTQRETLQWMNDNLMKERLLPSGKPLTDAESWLNQRRHNLDADVIEFIEASKRREVGRKRLVTIASGALILVLTILTTYSLWQYNAATEQRNIAQTNQSQFLAELVRQKNVEQQYDTALLLGLNGLPGEYGGDRPWIDQLAVQVGIAQIFNRKQVVFPQGALSNDGRVSFDGKLVVTASDSGIATLWDRATGQQLQSFQHQGRVEQAFFAKGNDAIFTVSADGTVAKWAATDGMQLFELQHGDNVEDADLSPDGSLIVTGSWDNTAAVWDARTGEQLMQAIHSDYVRDVAISRDNRFLASASNDSTAKVWDINAKQLKYAYQFDHRVESTSFHPNGQLVAFGSYDGTVLIVDVFTGEALLDLGGNDRVWDLAFSRQGDLIAVAGDPGTINVYSIPDGELRQTFAHQGSVTKLEFNQDGTELLTASLDNSAVRWDLDNGQKLQEMRHVDDVRYARYTPDGTAIITGGYDGYATIWEFGADGKSLEYKHDSSAIKVAVSPNNQYLASISRNGEVWLFDLTDKQKVWSRRHKEGSGSANISFSASGNKLLSSSSNGAIAEWLVDTGEQIAVYEHNALIRYVTYSPDGSLVASGGHDNKVKVWDSGDGSLLQEYAHSYWISSIDFSSDGKQILTASFDGTARLFNVGDTTPLLTFEHNDAIYQAKFSPDNKAVFTASGDGSLVKWDSVSGEPLVTFRHNDGVWRFSFAHRHPWVVTASWDDTAVVWDYGTGEALYQFEEQDDVLLASFSQDDQFLLTSSASKSSKLWGVKGEILFQEFAHLDNSGFSMFSRDDKQVITTSADGVVIVWDINQSLYKLRELASAGDSVTATQQRRAFIESLESSLPVNRKCLTSRERNTHFLPEANLVELSNRGCATSGLTDLN